MTLQGFRIWRHTLPLATLATLLLFGISLLLITWRVEQMLTDLALQQSLRTAHTVRHAAEQGMRLGVGLEDQTGLVRQLQALQHSDPTITGVQLRTTGQQALVELGSPKVPTQRTKNQGPSDHIIREGAHAWLDQPITDAAGLPAGSLWMAFDYQTAQQQARSLGWNVLRHVWPWILLCVLCLTWALREHLSPPALQHQRRWKYLATACCALSLMVTPLTVLWQARQAAKPLVNAQIHSNVSSLGTRLAQELSRALDAGIPYAALQGVPAWLQQAQATADEVDAIELVTSHAAAPTTSVLAPTTQSPYAIALTYPQDVVDQQLSNIVLDLVLAVVISAFLVYEVSRGRWLQLWQMKASQRADSPPADTLRQTRRDLSKIRFFVFLVALSEELLRPFLTVFAAQLDSQVSSYFSAGLPVAAFMLTLAMAQPLGPWLADRWELRKLMVVTAIMGTTMLALSATAQSITALVIWRCAAGMAYGLALILAQTAIVRITARQQRAQGMTSVSAAIVAAGIVGPPFGGMVAAQLGPHWGFIACAMCMACAVAAIVRIQPQPHDAQASQQPSKYVWRAYRDIWREPRAMGVIWGAALPARLAAVGILSILIPLYASDLQAPSAVTGRILLLYFLVFALTVSAFATWSDRTGHRRSIITAGGLVCAAACASIAVIDGIWGLAVCSALLGLGQAMQSSPQVALITEAFEDNPERLASPEQALAAFRLLERGGSVIAPLLIAAAISAWGYAGAILSLGLYLLIASLGMYAYLSHHSTHPVRAGHAP